MNNILTYLILAAATWFMTGVIWFVQVVHYPLFAKVGTEQFTGYALSHCNLTSSVVALPMVAQALLSLWVAASSTPDNAVLLWVNFFLVLLIWVMTATCSVPSHNRLCADGFSELTHTRLVLTNWVRTALWSLCSVLVTIVLLRRLQVF